MNVRKHDEVYRSRSKRDKSDQSAESVEEPVNEVKQIADSILYA